MTNVLKHNNYKFCLIGKIKGLAVESKRTRTRLLHSKSDQAVWRLSYRKRIVGIDIRHHLLAYAFLRGTPYSMLERTCREDNKPDANLIFKIVQAHAPAFLPYDTYTKTGGGSYTATLENVTDWLAGRSL